MKTKPILQFFELAENIIHSEFVQNISSSKILKNKYTVNVPGCKKQDFTAKLNKNTLDIFKKQKKFKTFNVPYNTLPENINISVEDGVLTVSILNLSNTEFESEINIT